MNAYIYRHIRTDTNQVFYIGIGISKNYLRARAITGRNIHWKSIVAKTSYEVEILMDGLDYEFAKIKEIEFIKLYGRSIYGGTLCNMTDGGQGGLGVIVTKEKRDKISKSNKGKKRNYEQRMKFRKAQLGHKVTEETRAKISKKLKGKIFSEETRRKLSISCRKKVSELQIKLSF